MAAAAASGQGSPLPSACRYDWTDAADREHGDAAGRYVSESRQLHPAKRSPNTAALLLIAAGDHPERLPSEAAWAHLCGAAPILASSGKTVSHRLNPSGALLLAASPADRE